MLRLQHPLTGLGWWPLPRSPRWSADCAIVVPSTEHASARPLAMATVSGRSPERCRRTESGRHNAPRGGQLQHSRGRTRDHGTPPAMQSCFGSASDAMLGAICRTTVDAPLCAELLKMDLSAQALWQEKHTFSLTKSQYLVECSRARQDVLVRSGHGAGRARMRVPTCSARPAPRYAVLYRFHFSARRAPARGVGDFFFGNQSGVLHRTPTGRLGALYRAPIRGPGRLYYVSKVDTVYRNSIPVLRWRPLGFQLRFLVREEARVDELLQSQLCLGEVVRQRWHHPVLLDEDRSTLCAVPPRRRTGRARWRHR